MKQTPEINELAKALLLVQSELKSIEKDSINPHFKNKYASLTAVIDSTRGPLAKQSLMIVQTHSTTTEGQATLVTTLLHSSGQYIQSHLPLVLSKQDMQGMGSATSYARRYGLLAILNLAAEDDDGAHASDSEPKATTPYQKPVVSMWTKPSPTVGAAILNAGSKGYPSDAQLKRLFAICKSNGWSEGRLNDLLRTKYGISDKSQIASRADYETICKTIEQGSSPTDNLEPPPIDDRDYLPF